MKIYFKNNQLAKVCASEKASQKKWGSEITKKLYQRLAEFHAANNLEEICFLPAARCHQLKGKRSGQFAVDLKHPYRLIFEPANDPIPLKPDGGIDRKRVTAICIIGVVDYHGE